MLLLVLVFIAVDPAHFLLYLELFVDDCEEFGLRFLVAGFLETKVLHDGLVLFFKGCHLSELAENLLEFVVLELRFGHLWKDTRTQLRFSVFNTLFSMNQWRIRLIFARLIYIVSFCFSK